MLLPRLDVVDLNYTTLYRIADDVVLVEFQRSRGAIPRDVASEIESCLLSVLDWETGS